MTAFDKDGPTDGPAFRERYGTVLSSEGNTFVTSEVEHKEDRDAADKITWRCTFEYPRLRTMEALGSGWANRADLFLPVKDGTMWGIRWDTGIGGIRGLVQYIVFRLVGHKGVRRAIVDPVKGHFEGR